MNGEAQFIRTHTTLTRAPLVPELALHLATEITPIWHATEEWLTSRNMPPPYWAFAWPGGQALARYILDHPENVAGRRVLDFAAGSGIAGIAAARVGARVEAVEIDSLAITAIGLNAGVNGVTIAASAEDIVGTPCRWDLILCGDVCYDKPMTMHITPWLRSVQREVPVWLADPGRAYLPQQGLRALARYQVATSRELEDHTEREVTVYRLE